MKNLVGAGVGLLGATLSGVAAWVMTVSHETPGKASACLLHGVDEYWNGDYPESERPW